ncbi:DNA translocase FtsK [bacterium]|nr:DNA translocase FtsK [bacterium]
MFSSLKEKQRNDLIGLLLLAFSILIFISLKSYDSADIAFNISTPNRPVHNYIGISGAYIGFGLFLALGFAAYFVPIIGFISSINRFRQKPPQNIYVKILGIVLLLCGGAVLFVLINMLSLKIFLLANRFEAGGILGLFLAEQLKTYLEQTGAYIVAVTVFISGFLLCTEFSLSAFSSYIAGKFSKKDLIINRNITRKIRTAGLKQVQTKAVSEKQSVSKETVASVQPDVFQLPPLTLLDLPSESDMASDDASMLDSNSEILEQTLRDFGIEAKVTQINQGPAITSYELQPAPGVKVQNIVALANDIALNLKAQSVRIVAPIPGKDVVGIEIPNRKRQPVYLREVLESNAFKNTKSKLALAFGKDIQGECLVADIEDMPHILIAGTTGAGKSVCISSLIMSMLYNSYPSEVQFLMIDPKMVELSAFSDIPQLITPIVTDAKKAANALKWIVGEMEDRYQKLAKANVRNIAGYNKIVSEGNMPYIVVVIDELADLMSVARRDVEESITRLAQLSRAAGIHIILATQRPSVDVITGVIKANFPCRLSFQVSSKVDSRTVLDMNGAEILLGKGDMLFLPAGSPKPVRAQACFVSDKEISRTVNFLKKQAAPSYRKEILEEPKAEAANGEEWEKDDLFEDAVKVVLDTHQASSSVLQRRLRIGYARAARLIDMMEAEGIVGSLKGSKGREILIDSYEAEE